MICLVGTSQFALAAPFDMGGAIGSTTTVNGSGTSSNTTTTPNTNANTPTNTVSTTNPPPGTTDSPQSQYVGQVLLEEPKYPLDNYKLETQIPDGGVTGLGNVGDKAMAGMNNGLWSLNKQIGDFAIYAVSELLSYDLISKITDKMATISNNIYSGMSSVFLSLFITIAVGIAAYRYFINRHEAGGFKALLGTLLIMVVMFGYFNNTSQVITYINSFSQFVDGKAMSANISVSTTQNLDPSKVQDPKEGTALLQNQLFELMILRPYLLLQYGTTNEADINKQDPNRVDTLLSIKPYGDQALQLRKQIVDNEVNNLGNIPMSPGYEGERFGKILLTILLTIIVTVPVLIMAGMAFLLQIFLICLLIFAAIPLCMALIPSFIPTAGHFFKKVISLVLHKAALTLIISVALFISTLAYDLTNQTSGLNGYMMMAFIVALINFGIFWFRREILHVITLGSIGAGNVADRITQANSMKKVAEKTHQKGKDTFNNIVDRIKGNSKKSPARKGDSGGGSNNPPKFKVVRGRGEGNTSASRGGSQTHSSGGNTSPSRGTTKVGTEVQAPVGEKTYPVANWQDKGSSSQTQRSSARDASPKNQVTGAAEWKTKVYPTYQPSQQKTEPSTQRESQPQKETVPSSNPLPPRSQRSSEKPKSPKRSERS